MNNFFYNVSIAIPLRQAFTYHSDKRIPLGTRVAVKFGAKLKLGIILDETKQQGIQTKPIHQVLDDEPIFSAMELNILSWASHYYHHPIGVVCHGVGRGGLCSVTTVVSVDAFRR